jgi:MinD superfamily P-loop ATPase
MTRYLRENNIPSIDAVRGRTLSQIRSYQDLHKINKGEVWAEVDPQACDNCQLCMKRCYFDAIQPVDNMVTILKEKCDGCGLCVVLCHKQAIRMISGADLFFGDFS